MPDGLGPFPTAILVHGGGFLRGDKQSYIEPIFEPLSQAGFACFAINFKKQMRKAGNTCGLFTIPDGVQGTGGGDKAPPECKGFLVEWLKKTLGEGSRYDQRQHPPGQRVW